MKLPDANKRLEKVIEFTSNGNQNQFSKDIDISQPRINRLFKPDKRSGKYPLVSFEIIQAVINKFINIDPDWLITGKGKIFRAQNKSKSDQLIGHEKRENEKLNVPENVTVSKGNKKGNAKGKKPNVPKNEVMELGEPPGNAYAKSDKKMDIFKLRTDVLKRHQIIPIYSMEASAGIVTVFGDLNDSQPVDYMDIPKAPNCDGAIFAVGDSMYPLIKSGDLLGYKYVTDLPADIFWGEMYILSIDRGGEEMVTVKYVQKGAEKEYIKLVSQNRHHEDKEVHLSKIRGMALIKLTLRYNSMA